jgi:hypothetical protein
MDSIAFSDRLNLVLKALSLSRARLAADLEVDKSLVGRWAAGKVMPSGHNLARLTERVALRQPGFTMLDWDRDLEGLADRLGVSTAAASKPLDWVPPALLAEALRGADARGGAYEGLWRSTRPSSDLPGRFLHDHLMIRRTPNGPLGFRTGVEGVLYEGWALLLQHQLFSIATDSVHGTLLFSIFNGVARQKAEMLDGLTLACLRDAGGSPVASTCLLERVGDLTGDNDEDDRRYSAFLAAQGSPLAPEGSVPEQVRAHLTRAIDPDLMGQGGLLRMYFGQSMARGASLTAGAERP